MATIVLKNIKKQYPNGFEAIPEINLEIADREFLVLVGPSGCAKSTALRMVAGLEDITAGDLFINGKRMNDVEPKDRNIAMVFQSYALYPHMSVYENIGFRLKIKKRPKAEIDQRVKAAAEILGITDLLDRKPRQLSGGQRQRVALGRAIVRQPEVFLFDEPLSNLDAKLRLQMRTEIKKLHDKLKATIIYVTHDQVEAMTMGSRVAVMRRGLIQQLGPPLGLYNHPANRFVAGFIGSPSMNFVPCRITDKAGALFVDTDGFQLRLPDRQAANIKKEPVQPYTFGIRPEDIRKKRSKQEKYSTAELVGRVNVIEPLGKEISLELGVGEVPFTAIIGANQEVELHQDIEMVLNMDKVHLFKQSEGEENILGSPVG